MHVVPFPGDLLVAWLELDLGRPTTFKRALISEAFPNRVQKFDASFEHVLDIGSGNGQKARVLAGYLNSEGRYEGFDIVAKVIPALRYWASTSGTQG